MRHQLGKDEEKGSLMPSSSTQVTASSPSAAGTPNMSPSAAAAAASDEDANGKNKKMPTKCQLFIKKLSLFLDQVENVFAVIAMIIMVSGFLIYVHRRAERADPNTVAKAMANMTAGNMMSHAQTFASEAVGSLQNASLDELVDTYTAEINEHVGYIQELIDQKAKGITLATAEKLAKLSNDLKATVAEAQQEPNNNPN